MWLQVTLLSIFITTILAGIGASPLLPSIAEHFTGGELFAHMFFVTPSLVSIPFLLLSGFLSSKISKIKLIKIGLVLFIIGGLGCMLAYNQSSMLFFRAIIGIALGLTMPLGVALISDYYYGPAREKVLSYSMIVTYASAIVILLLTGGLVLVYWRIAFLINLIAIIPLFLISKNLGAVQKKTFKHHYPVFFAFIFKIEIYKLLFLNFLVILLTFVYFSNITFFIIDTKIGGAFEASIAQSITMFFAILSNFLMHPIKKISAKILLALQTLFMAQALLMLSSYNISITEVYISACLLGIGYGSFYSSIVADITTSSSRINKVNAIAFSVASMYLAQFLSPLFFENFDAIFHIKNYATDFLLVGIFFSIFAIYLFIKFLLEHRKLIGVR